MARLTGYLRALHGSALTTTGGGRRRALGTISSEELAALAGVNPAKLRKDLSYLGSYGTRGVGYDVTTLVETLSHALGAHRSYPVAIAGCGHLGRALAGYPGFAQRGFPVRVLLDSDPDLIGRRIAGVVVTDIADAMQRCASQQIAIGVIATPHTVAQQVADVLVSAGVRSILNFAPQQLAVPDDVEVRGVDLALELTLLAFHESRRARDEATSTVTAS